MTTASPKDKDARPPKGCIAVPLSVQLEVALQNQRLAEVRYKASVKRGRAWDIHEKTTKSN